MRAATVVQVLQDLFYILLHILFYLFYCKIKQNVNEGCNSCASLAGLVLYFIACFILLVITPLATDFDLEG